MKKTKITRIMMSLVVLSAIVVAGGEFQLVASDYNLLKGYGTKL